MVLYFFWKISKCTIKFENQNGQPGYAYLIPKKQVINSNI